MAEQVRVILGVDACVIRLLEGDALVLLASAGIPKGTLYSRIPANVGVGQDILSRRQPLFVRNVHTNPVTAAIVHHLRRRYEFTSYGGAPLLVKGRVIGVFGIYAVKEMCHFTDADLVCLQIFANGIACVIANHKLYGEMKRQRDRLESETADRRRAEEALRESETRFRALIENSADAVAMVAADGVVLYKSPSASRILGFPAEERVGGNAFELVHPEDVGRVKALWAALLQVPGATVTGVVRCQHADGSWRWIEAVGTNLLGQPGVKAIVVNYRDITDRRRAEREVRESEQRFRAIADYTYGWENWVGPDGRLLWINPGVEAMTGYSPAECMAMPDFPLPIIHEDDREAIGAAFREAVRGTTGNDLTFRVRRKDGAVMWASVSWQPIYDADGVSLGHRSSFRDITRRKLTEEALEASEKRFRVVTENSLAGVYIFGRGHFLYVNPVMAQIFGYEREEIMAMTNPLDLVHPDDRELAGGHLGRRLQDRAGVAHYVARILRKDGSVGFCEALGRYLEYEGEPAIIGTLWDITERKRAEQERERLNTQLREAQKLEALGRFGRGVAHDFNNLMATVLGLASNMRSNRRPGDPDYTKLTHIEEAAETAARLAHQLLTFAKGGKIRPRLLPFADVVKSALALVPPMASRNVTVDSRIAEDLWRVECDQTQIQQVIVNLCRNALEAMPKGGHLRIEAENATLASPLNDAQLSLAAGDYVCLSVEDTGCGMDTRTMKLIFDPFFTTKKQGHGLGLAAAYGVVGVHGGAISVTSEPGKGSMFRMWLPREKKPGK